MLNPFSCLYSYFQATVLHQLFQQDPFGCSVGNEPEYIEDFNFLRRIGLDSYLIRNKIIIERAVIANLNLMAQL
jgi:hypothetical protein